MLQVVANHPEIKFPYSRSRGPQRPKSDKFCHFHNEYEHDTNNCYHFKDGIERMIQAGYLKEFIYQDRQGPRGQKKKEPEKKREDKGKAPQGEIKDQPQPSQKRGTIQMIMGGPTSGDSFRQRKMSVRALKARRCYVDSVKMADRAVTQGLGRIKGFNPQMKRLKVVDETKGQINEGPEEIIKSPKLPSEDLE
ncbi:hypothetical protein ACS0TY_027334 [Phlomoides rotata]